MPQRTVRIHVRGRPDPEEHLHVESVTYEGQWLKIKVENGATEQEIRYRADLIEKIEQIETPD